MSQHPPFTIISFEQTDFLNDTGDDIVFFYVDVEMNKQLYQCLVPFHKLLNYLDQNKPADAAYFDKLRRSINGFGPKQTVVLRLANEEGYDIEKALTGYIGDGNILDKLTPKIIQTDTQQEALTEQVEELGLLAEESKPFTLRDIAFKDEVMDMLNKKVLEIYPEIFNSRSEYITELQDLLINHVLKFGDDINNLAWKAYKEP